MYVPGTYSYTLKDRRTNTTINGRVAGVGASSRNPGASFAKPQSSPGHPTPILSVDDALGTYVPGTYSYTLVDRRTNTPIKGSFIVTK